MQIQRLQNLYLLLAFIAALVSLNFNWLRIDAIGVSACNNVPLLVLGLLATLLPLLALFLFKNLSRQKLAARLSALFALFTLGYVIALSYLGPNPEAEVCILAPCLMALGGVLDCLATRAIAADQRLLKSADRLR